MTTTTLFAVRAETGTRARAWQVFGEGKPGENGVSVWLRWQRHVRKGETHLLCEVHGAIACPHMKAVERLMDSQITLSNSH